MYFMLILIAWFLSIFIGYAIEPAIVAALGYIDALITGFILFLLYFTNVYNHNKTTANN